MMYLSFLNVDYLQSYTRFSNVSKKRVFLIGTVGPVKELEMGPTRGLDSGPGEGPGKRAKRGPERSPERRPDKRPERRPMS